MSPKPLTPIKDTSLLHLTVEHDQVISVLAFGGK